jgi:hypothetical protein
MANGARKNLMDNFGKTAFMKTVEMGHTTVARFFMENGAHPRTTNPDGWTAVMVAGGNEDLEMLRLLRDYGAEITLHFAAMIGDMVKAQELLASGVDINATDEFGRTPLMWAAAMRQSEMVKLLVDKGAKVNIRDPNGWTALMWAAKNSRIETLDFLLGKGADVNASAGNGWTALMWSVSNKQTEAVKLLLNRNADVEAADWKGMTALELAHETQKIREMLEARGAWKPPTDHGKRSNQCEAEWDFSSLEILTGSPAPRSPHQTIRMDSQEVIMRLGEKSFVIEGAYRFFNTGRTTTEWIAFPKKGNACRDGRLLNPAFMRFQVWIDGAKADFSEERGSFRMPTDLFPATKATHSQSVGKSIDNYDRWLGQMVTFPAQKGLTIRLRYEDRYVVHDAPPTLDAESPSSLDEATYIMGTGSFWRDRIRHSAFVVDASGVGGTKHLVGLPSRGLARMTDTLVRYEERDYEPESGSTISIGVRPPRVSESASKRRW